MVTRLAQPRRYATDGVGAGAPSGRVTARTRARLTSCSRRIACQAAAGSWLAPSCRASAGVASGAHRVAKDSGPSCTASTPAQAVQDAAATDAGSA